MKKIGIIANLSKPGAEDLMNEASAWLNRRDCSVMTGPNHSVDEIIRQVDLIVCLGGDGTLLSVAGKMKEHAVPILGVNLGSLGFLTEVKKEEIFDELKAFLADQFTVENRLLLSCAVKSQKLDRERRLVGLNDIVVSREGLTRLLTVDVMVSGEQLTRFSGDGLIIASPTGSTAYSLSAGGAIVHPKVEALIITPICPHASSLRPMVVSVDEKISVKIRPTQAGENALLTVDGQENLEIDDSYNVEITKSNTLIPLIKSSRRSYFATLRENFKFPT